MPLFHPCFSLLQISCVLSISHMEMHRQQTQNYILRPRFLTYLSTKTKNLLTIVLRGYGWQLAKGKARKHKERESALDIHPDAKKKKLKLTGLWNLPHLSHLPSTPCNDPFRQGWWAPECQGRNLFKGAHSRWAGRALVDDRGWIGHAWCLWRRACFWRAKREEAEQGLQAEEEEKEEEVWERGGIYRQQVMGCPR